jgi:hypothetical protein
VSGPLQISENGNRYSHDGYGAFCCAQYHQGDDSVLTWKSAIVRLRRDGREKGGYLVVRVVCSSPGQRRFS